MIQGNSGNLAFLFGNYLSQTAWLNVRFAPKAAIREMDFLQCNGSRFGPAIGQ
jgi:hypothetical protein